MRKPFEDMTHEEIALVSQCDVLEVGRALLQVVDNLRKQARAKNEDHAEIVTTGPLTNDFRSVNGEIYAFNQITKAVKDAQEHCRKHAAN